MRCVCENAPTCVHQSQQCVRLCVQSSEAPSPIDANDAGSSHTPAVGKPGRKKNPKYDLATQHDYICSPPHVAHLSSSQAARRDQNRIAQREFRLRKQQRVSVHHATAHYPPAVAVHECEGCVWFHDTESAVLPKPVTS